MSQQTRGGALLGGVLLLGVLATGASAQVDPRWAAFVGCWVPAGAPAEAGLLCFRPATAGVEMFNVVGGEVVATEPLIADGVARPVTAEGCTGTERVEFSADGLRAFTRSDFTCAGEARSGSGVMSFVTPGEWIDVRALSVGGEPVAWVQRYELASADLAALGVDDPAAGDPNLVRAARIRAAGELEVADVEDAAGRIDTRAVEVWVAAHETPFDLSGSDLVRLADGGMPESIIDVMVAVSYPDRFMVSPEGSASPSDPTVMAGGYDPYLVGPRRGYRAYLFDPFYGGGYRYDPYFNRYGYMNGFGYYGVGGFGGYGGYWGYVPATIIVQPATPQPTGRMVPGRGYTRNNPSSSGSSGGASPPAQSSGSSGSGGGGSSSGGSSSGSSSGGGGDGGSRRTAQPRN